jgi:hypothetical protein
MQSKKLIPDPKVCERYGVTPMTLWRWDHDANLKFPKPTYIRGRKYRDERELDEFDEARKGAPHAAAANTEAA